VVLFCLGIILCAPLALLGGWRLCRGLTRSETTSTLDGVPVVRVTLDPGPWPWSGAQVVLLDPETPGLEIER